MYGLWCVCTEVSEEDYFIILFIKRRKAFGKTDAFLCFLLYRKFLKQSEIVYNGLEIKNDMTKERMVDSP